MARKFLTTLACFVLLGCNSPSLQRFITTVVSVPSSAPAVPEGCAPPTLKGLSVFVTFEEATGRRFQDQGDFSPLKDAVAEALRIGNAIPTLYKGGVLPSRHLDMTLSVRQASEGKSQGIGFSYRVAKADLALTATGQIVANAQEQFSLAGGNIQYGFMSALESNEANFARLGQALVAKLCGMPEQLKLLEGVQLVQAPVPGDVPQKMAIHLPAPQGPQICLLQLLEKRVSVAIEYPLSPKEKEQVAKSILNWLQANAPINQRSPETAVVSIRIRKVPGFIFEIRDARQAIIFSGVGQLASCPGTRDQACPLTEGLIQFLQNLCGR